MLVWIVCIMPRVCECVECGIVKTMPNIYQQREGGGWCIVYKATYVESAHLTTAPASSRATIYIDIINYEHAWGTRMSTRTRSVEKII